MNSRAVDAWSALLALSGKRAKVISNIAVVLVYAGLYLQLRDWSNDQWYLPAGLRFAALLLAPTRFWPALYCGDILAMAGYRFPRADINGWTWSIVSLFPGWPIVAAIVHQLRKHTSVPRIARPMDAAALAVGALLASEFVALVSKAFTAYFRPGAGPMRYSDLIVYSLGDIQGIMVAACVVVLAVGMRQPGIRIRAFAIEAAVAVLVMAAFGYAVVQAGISDPIPQVAARLSLLVPAVALALRFGWRGAAIGAIASNIALFCTIPHQDKGMSDSAALVMQEVFTFLSWALFILGARGQAPAQEALRSALALPDQSLQSPESDRARFNSLEIELREKALRAEAFHSTSRRGIEPLVAILRSNGQPEAAMNLIGAAHVESAQFRGIVVDGIYPLTVERDGLSAALHSDAFRAKFGEAKCRLDITGRVHEISLETALSAYRVLGESIEYLLSSKPVAIDIRMRCTCRDGAGHIGLTLTAREPAMTGRSPVDTARLATLRTRARAFNGSFHSRPHRIRVFLADVPSDCARREAGAAVKQEGVATLP